MPRDVGGAPLPKGALSDERRAEIRGRAERHYLPAGERLSDQIDPRLVDPGLIELEQLVNEDVPALLTEVERATAAMTYFQGPEECLERECEDYFDASGEERTDLKHCSHLKAKRLSVDDYLAALEERDAARAARDRFAAELDRLGGHLVDPRLIRLAISDPGAFVKRERFNDGDRESIPAWAARAVVEALKNGKEVT